MSTIFLFSTNLDNWTDWHFWLLVIIGGVVYAIARNKVGEKNEIREAEKRRRKTPSIQAGRFCSLFTMPYIEEACPHLSRPTCSRHIRISSANNRGIANYT